MKGLAPQWPGTWLLLSHLYPHLYPQFPVVALALIFPWCFRRLRPGAPSLESRSFLLLATPCLQAVLTACARSLRHFTQQGGQAWGGQAWGGLAPLSACWTSTTPPGTFLTLFLRHSNHSEAATFPSHFWVPLARSRLPWLKGLLFFTVLLRPSCPW